MQYPEPPVMRNRETIYKEYRHKRRMTWLHFASGVGVAAGAIFSVVFMVWVLFNVI